MVVEAEEALVAVEVEAVEVEAKEAQVEAKEAQAEAKEAQEAQVLTNSPSQVFHLFQAFHTTEIETK